MLHELKQFADSVTQDYDQYAFSKGMIFPPCFFGFNSQNLLLKKVVKSLSNFAAIDLSAFYFEIIKDRLYSELKAGEKRRAVQTTLARVSTLSLLLFLTIMV